MHSFLVPGCRRLGLHCDCSAACPYPSSLALFVWRASDICACCWGCRLIIYTLVFMILNWGTLNAIKL
jgi:hypothetical protein